MIFKWIKLQNLRLRTKLIVSYIFLTVLPMSLLGYIAYGQFTDSIEAEVGEYIPKLLEQANENIDNQLREIRQLPNQLYNSSQVIAVLRKDAYQNQSSLLTDQFIVNNYLTRSYINGSHIDILGVFILSKNRTYESVKVPYSNFDLSQQILPYGTNLDLRGNEEWVVLPHQTTLQFQGAPPYIIFMRQLTDFENQTNLGTMLIVVELTFIKSVINKLNADEKAELWMMDKNGRIIYHSNPLFIGEIDEDFSYYPKINGSFRTVGETSNRLISINELESWGWTLAHSILMKNLTERTEVVKNMTVIVFLIIIGFSIVISIIMAMTVTNPLNSLMKLMKSVEKGNFNVDFPIHSRDEVGMLAKSFNSMVNEIQDLIREKYQIELKQKEAEL